MGRGGQVSIEFLIVTGFSLMLLVPMLVLFYSQTDEIQSAVWDAQAQDAAETIAYAAERVYYAGPESRETVRVRLPEGTAAVIVRNASITVEMTKPTYYDVVVASAVPLLDTTLASGEGLAVVRLDATTTGVQITEI